MSLLIPPQAVTLSQNAVGTWQSSSQSKHIEAEGYSKCYNQITDPQHRCMT